VTTNQQLIHWLEQARANLMSSIDGLTDEQMERREIDGWSVKDHLIHLMVWDEMRFHETSRIARGGGPSMHPVDEAGIRWINEGFAEARRHLPLSQVLDDLRFAHEMVKQAVAAAPEERLDEKLYGEIGAIGAGHEAGHAGIIRTWREKAGL
jgi:hypothetical protein